MSKTAVKVIAIICTVLCSLLIFVYTVNTLLSPPATYKNTVEVRLTIDNIEKFGAHFTYISTKEYPSHNIIVENDDVLNTEAFNNLSQGDVVTVRVPDNVLENKYYGGTTCLGLKAKDSTIISAEKALKKDKERFIGVTFAFVFFTTVFGAIAIVCFCSYKGVLGRRKGDNTEQTQY